MRMFDIIEKKKNNLSLTEEELSFAVNGYVKGEIADYQMSALLMAIVLNGMNDNEISCLTNIMTNSGDKIDLSMFTNTVDKHSTGGVSDGTSLVIAPLVGRTVETRRSPLYAKTAPWTAPLSFRR